MICKEFFIMIDKVKEIVTLLLSTKLHLNRLINILNEGLVSLY